MQRFLRLCRRFLRAEDGPTAVEYAVVLAMILLVCIGAVKSVGSAVKGSLENTANQIAGAGGSGGSGSGSAASGGGSSSGGSGSSGSGSSGSGSSGGGKGGGGKGGGGKGGGGKGAGS